MSAASSTSASVMTSGGARRMMCSFVVLVSRPACISASHSAPASRPSPSGRTTTALSSPRPRTSAIAGLSIAARRRRRISPIAAEFSASRSSRSTSSAAIATAQPSGLPPYVEPCSPGRIVSITSSDASTAPNRVHAAAQRLTEDEHVGAHPLVIDGEHLSRAAQPGLYLVGEPSARCASCTARARRGGSRPTARRRPPRPGSARACRRRRWGRR